MSFHKVVLTMLVTCFLTFASILLWNKAFVATGEALSYASIYQGAGGFSATLDSADLFGSSLAIAGDINNDGVEDLVVGAMQDDDGGSNRGAVYILFMDADGSLDDTLPYAKISDTSGGFTATFQSTMNFGKSVAGIGDLNNDSVPDLAVGYSSGAGTYGYFILFMDADGTVDDATGYAHLNMVSLGLASFGQAVAGIGDLNGDGVEDMAVGAHTYSSSTGAIYILFMDADGTLDDSTPYQLIANSSGGLGASDITATSYFGYSIANIGDLNGDGITDLAVGAILDQSGKGAIYILFMDADGTVDDTLGYTKISSQTSGFTTQLDANDYFGSSVDGLGDLNGDGVSEVLVGAYRDGDGGSQRGAVYILYMDTDGTFDDASSPVFSKISDTSGAFTATLANEDRLGYAVASFSDLNADDLPDIAVTAAYNDERYPIDSTYDTGILYTIFLDGVSGDSTAPTVGGGGTITETADTDTSISLSWTAGTDETSAQGALVYKVYKAADTTDLSSVANIEANGTLVDTLTGEVAITVSSLTAETEYEFNVIVLDEAGNKAAYTQLGANTDPAPDVVAPTVSSGTITETGETDTTLTFSWTEATDAGTAQGSLSYKIYSAAEGADLDSVEDTEANGTLRTTVTGAGSGTISGLSELTTYAINIIVSDSAGNKSLYTQTSAATGATPDLTPPTPGNSGTLQKSSATSNTVTILWTQATDDETAQGSLVYRLYYATSGTDLDSVADVEANGTQFSNDFTSLNSLRITSLTANTAYTFQLLVEDASGNKAVYTQLSNSFTTATASSVPSLSFPANTIVSINEGMECTNTRDVVLDIQGANVDRVVVADDNRFLGAIWEFFTGSPMRRAFTLKDQEGEQTVYVIFRSWHGNKSFIHSDSIVYRPGDEDCVYVATDVETTDTTTETTTETDTTTESETTTTGISDLVAPDTATTTTDTSTGTTETTTTTTTDTTTGTSTTTTTTTDTTTGTSTTTTVTETDSGTTITEINEPSTPARITNPVSNATITLNPDLTYKIPRNTIVRVGGGNQYYYIDNNGIAYPMSDYYLVSSWMNVDAIPTVQRRDFRSVKADDSKILGPRPGTLIVVISGKYYWLESSPDGNPLTPVAREFASQELIREIFGKNWVRYRYIVVPSESYSYTVGPIISDVAQFTKNVYELKTLQEIRQETKAN